MGVQTVTGPGVYIFEGDGFTITITVTEEAKIPSGTQLIVSEIDPYSDEYIQHLGKAWAEINKEYLENEELKRNYQEGDDVSEIKNINPVNIYASRMFDISFMYGETEIEPEKPVQVEISYEDGMDAFEGMIPRIAHYGCEKLDIIEDVTTTVEDGKVVSFEYEQESFSYTTTLLGNETYDVSLGEGSEKTTGGDTDDDTTDDDTDSGSATLDPPTSKKALDYNGDGTYTLSLSVTGSAASSTDVTKTNVIVVMDRSSSMVNNRVYTYTAVSNPETGFWAPTYYGYVDGEYVTLFEWFGDWYYQDGNNYSEYTSTIYTRSSWETSPTRLDEEQDALDAMLTSMLSNNKPGVTVTDEDGNEISLADLIEVKVISFATARGDDPGETKRNDYSAADTESNWETTYGEDSDLYDIVYDDSTSSGTNWEEAMQYALAVANDKKTEAGQEDEDVYIIFMTDGEPTTHYGTYNVGWNVSYETELSYALDDAKAIVDAGYKFYSIFTYGTGSSADYLRKLVNYAYNYGAADDLKTDDAKGYLAKYFFDAKNTTDLLNALQKILSAITNAVAYGNVTITDGIATDSVTSTLVSGQASGFTYTVSGDVGTLYTVTATDTEGSSEPTVVFTINGTEYTGTDVKEGTYTYTADDTEYSKTYYYVTVDGTDYKMALASIDSNGLVTWDLGAIGKLMSGYTYTVSFIVWPDQDAYDYVAALNNGVTSITNSKGETVKVKWDETIAEDSGKGYDTGGCTAYPTIIKYTSGKWAGTYGVLTNTSQDLTYSVVTEKTDETTGNTTVEYSDSKTIHMDPADPMHLEGSVIELIKVWEDELIDSETAEEYHGESIELDLLMDSQQYISDITLYKEGAWTKAKFSIAPGIMVSRGKSAYAYGTQFVTYNTTSYAILDTGHDYKFEEDPETYDYDHYELTKYTYHPMLIDGTLYNVTFSYDKDGKINGVSDISAMSTIGATNTLKGDIYITKEVVDPNGKELEYDGLFQATVTLTAPKDKTDATKFDLSHLDTYTDADNVESVVARFRYYDEDNEAYLTEEQLITAELLEEDETAGAALPESIAEKGVQYASNGYFMLTFNERTGIAEGTVLLSAKYAIHFTSMAAGTQYSVTETQTNGMTASYTYTHTVYEPTKDDDGEYILDSDNNYVYGWVTTTDGDTHSVVGNAKNNVLVTNTSEYFYVYHSSDKTIEKIALNDARVTKETDEETKTVTYTFDLLSETKSGCLYGGYYKSYGGTSTEDDDIRRLEYSKSDSATYAYDSNKSNTTSNWAADPDTDAYAYTAEGGTTETWATADAYYKEDTTGKAMHPQANDIYYLKEVPDTFLRPVVFRTYKTYARTLTGCYLTTSVDDANYQEVGFITTLGSTTASLYENVEVTWEDNTTPWDDYLDDPSASEDATSEDEGSADGSSGETTYPDPTTVIEFRHVDTADSFGYIAMADNYCSALSTAFAAASDGTLTFTFAPYFVTPDGVRVMGINNRQIVIEDTYSDEKFDVAAEDGIIQSNEMTFSTFTYGSRYKAPFKKVQIFTALEHKKEVSDD